MKKPSCHDELTIRHRFDRLCQMSLKGEAINYYRHMDYRREHEAMFSELSEKELNQLSVMDEYGVENSHFTVHLMILPLVQIKKYGGKVLADTNGKQALRLVLMEKNARYVPVRE